MKIILKNKLIFISNILFYSGLILGAYGFYVVFKMRISLPEGVCPITDNRKIITFSIILLISSIILEWIGNRKIKK